jgi:hypothetical protein
MFTMVSPDDGHTLGALVIRSPACKVPRGRQAVLDDADKPISLDTVLRWRSLPPAQRNFALDASFACATGRSGQWAEWS